MSGQINLKFSLAYGLILIVFSYPEVGVKCGSEVKGLGVKVLDIQNSGQVDIREGNLMKKSEDGAMSIRYSPGKKSYSD